MTETEIETGTDESKGSYLDSLRLEDVGKRQKAPNLWITSWKRLQNNRFAIISLYYLALMVLIAVFYPLLISYPASSTDPLKQATLGGGARGRPSLRFPAGTSEIGFDNFTRILIGTETSLVVGILSTMIAISIGVVLGLIAGYYEGWIEEVIMRLTDFFLALPFLIIALLLIRLRRESEVEVIREMSTVMVVTLVIGFFGWAGTCRLVTATTKQVKSTEYVDAARVLGASDGRIMFLHILPNILAPIIVIATLSVAGGILSEAGLSYLGFGDPSVDISWGLRVNLGQNSIGTTPEQALIPGFCIFFLVLAINLLGDAVRDVLDPRLKE